MDFSKLPLRDWHEPGSVDWWPPAPGWWILVISSILILIAVRWLWRRLTYPTVKKMARTQLERLRSDSDLSDSDRVRHLSVLIRRICLSTYPRSEVAQLTGIHWLRFLDKNLGEPSFSEGPGKVLVDAPYRRDSEFDCDALFALCDRWIESLPETNAARLGSKPRTVA